jgi:hypothetical protein
MANGGQSLAGLDAPDKEAFDEAPLATWALIEGLLVVMKFPHIAKHIRKSVTALEGMKQWV